MANDPDRQRSYAGHWLRFVGAVSGCIAGLVAITPAAGFVETMPAVIIGLVGGGICYFAVAVVKAKLGYDDALDAFGIHGIGGMWGAIATGLWATKAINPAGADGLFYGSSDLLVAQLISIGVACVLAVAGSFILFKLVSAFMDVRMADADETAGLDIVEHGERGYAQAFLTGNPLGGGLSGAMPTMAANISLNSEPDIK